MKQSLKDTIYYKFQYIKTFNFPTILHTSGLLKGFSITYFTFLFFLRRKLVRVRIPLLIRGYDRETADRVLSIRDHIVKRETKREKN